MVCPPARRGIRTAAPGSCAEQRFPGPPPLISEARVEKHNAHPASSSAHGHHEPRWPIPGAQSCGPHPRHPRRAQQGEAALRRSRLHRCNALRLLHPTLAAQTYGSRVHRELLHACACIPVTSTGMTGVVVITGPTHSSRTLLASRGPTTRHARTCMPPDLFRGLRASPCAISVVPAGRIGCQWHALAWRELTGPPLTPPLSPPPRDCRKLRP